MHCRCLDSGITQPSYDTTFQAMMDQPTKIMLVKEATPPAVIYEMISRIRMLCSQSLRQMIAV